MSYPFLLATSLVTYMLFAPGRLTLLQEQIGNLTGSAAWTDSGAEQKQAGMDEMKAAGEKRDQDPQNHGMGKTEEIAGKLTGCEGMEKEGAASTQK